MRQWRKDLASALKKDTEDFWTIVKHLPGTNLLHQHASLSNMHTLS